MKVINGKIVEATEKELFDYYLTRGWDDLMPFSEYLERMRVKNVKIIGELSQKTQQSAKRYDIGYDWTTQGD